MGSVIAPTTITHNMRDGHSCLLAMNPLVGMNADR
jgi:hypothetical protein